MGKHCALPGIRKQLDDAITYESRKKAWVIACAGLCRARKRNDEAEAQYFLAQKDILKNRFVSAIEHLDKAIALNPADGAAFNDRALCMVELGIIDEALGFFDRGIAVEPDYATIHHNKGWLLNNIGRFRESVDCFKKALEREPGRAVTYDSLADSLYNLGDLPAALAAYRRVLSLLKPGQCRSIRKLIRERIVALEKTTAHH